MCFFYFMSLVELIDCLNHSIAGFIDKGHFVLHTSIIPNTTFKVYKDVVYTLWFIKDKVKIQSLTMKYTGKIPESNKDKNIHDLDLGFTKVLLEWILSGEYKKIIGGDNNETT